MCSSHSTACVKGHNDQVLDTHIGNITATFNADVAIGATHYECSMC